MEFNFTRVQINDLIDKSILINQPLAQISCVSLQKCQNTPSCWINGDENRLIQVLTNFISNACKNPPHNSVIFFEVTEKDSSIRVGIKDSGSGIPKEFHSSLFQKFSQVPSESSRAKKGTGLGLSICKSIIDRHGGCVGFDTSPEGSTFWFELAKVAEEI